MGKIPACLAWHRKRVSLPSLKEWVLAACSSRTWVLSSLSGQESSITRLDQIARTCPFGRVETSSFFFMPVIRTTPMGTRDARVDAYIAKSADFARPILNHLREVVHAACPDVEETMKWSFPHFQYQGMLCSMASFKEHCAFGFWKGSLVVGKDAAEAEKAAGQFGRLTKVSDLPSKKVLTGYIKEAMKLNEDGVKPRPREAEGARRRRRSRRPDQRPRGQPEGPGHLRRLQPQPQARIHRVDHRGQDRGHPHAPAGDGRRVDGRGEGAELEVHELLSGLGSGSRSLTRPRVWAPRRTRRYRGASSAIRPR